MQSLLQIWEEQEARGIEGRHDLILEDRYYLLVKVLGRKDMLHPWLFARCREVEAEPDGYLDLWARDHRKSTIITYAGVIQAVLGNPELTVGIFSHTSPIAKAFLAQIKREFETNDRLREAFPKVIWENPHRDAPVWSLDAGIVLKRHTNPKEDTIEAHGLVDGQPVSKHFQLRVYDDVVVPASVATPEQIQKTTSAWEISDNLGTIGGRVWHIGTRYSYADTYESMMTRGAVKPRIYPATHNGLIDGDPVFFSVDEWKRRVRDQGDAVVSCQLLQNPLAGQQRMFDVADLRTYEVRPETLQVYILVDPARSQKKGSADTAMVVIGIDYAGNKYLLDGYAHRMDLMERWLHLKDLYVKWRRATGVQGLFIGYEAYGAQADLDYIRERQRTTGPMFEIEELAWPRDGEASKTDRVQRLGPDFRNNRFYIPYPTDPQNLTRTQRNLEEQGYGFRIAKPIKRKDSENNLYDLTEMFKTQVHFFPYGGKKDVVDACSRLYDLEPRPPEKVDERSLEPEIV